MTPKRHLAALALSGLPLGQSGVPTGASPAEIYHVESRRYGLQVSVQNERDELADADQSATVNSEALNVQIQTKASPSFYWGVQGLVFKDAGELEISGRSTSDVRQMIAIDSDVSYKILDRGIISLGAGARSSRSTPEEGESSRATAELYRPALLIKSEWYEIGWTQTVLAAKQDFGGGDARRSWYHERTYHARYFPSESRALSLRYRTNPFGACCLAARSRRTALTFGWMEQLPSVQMITVEGAVTSFSAARADDPQREPSYVPERSVEVYARMPLADAAGVALSFGVSRGGGRDPEQKIGRATSGFAGSLSFDYGI